MSDTRPQPGFHWANGIPIPVVCETCGALVPAEEQRKHRDWHEAAGDE